MSRVEADFANNHVPTLDEITMAFYQACCGCQRETAEYLLARGADINWIPNWGSKKKTPLDVARDYEGAISQQPPGCAFGRMVARSRREIRRRAPCVIARTPPAVAQPGHTRTTEQLDSACKSGSTKGRQLAKCLMRQEIIWWKGRDSNPRPRHYEPSSWLKVDSKLNNLPRGVRCTLARRSTTEHN
jgi:hypothetical protein